ncbi:hypothetical protein MRX96_054557 [Rhipicephalus microplus]
MCPSRRTVGRTSERKRGWLHPCSLAAPARALPGKRSGSQLQTTPIARLLYYYRALLFVVRVCVSPLPASELPYAALFGAGYGEKGGGRRRQCRCGPRRGSGGGSPGEAEGRESARLLHARRRDFSSIGGV